MANTFTNLLYHIVFSTKHRKPLIDESLRNELYPYIGGIIRGERGILLEIGGIADHIHIVAKLKADSSVADIVRLVKANSSKWSNQRLKRKSTFGWQTGYAAFTVSESQLAAVRSYVRNQERHHRKLTFQQEYVALLRKHGIEFDPQYLWD